MITPRVVQLLLVAYFCGAGSTTFLFSLLFSAVGGSGGGRFFRYLALLCFLISAFLLMQE